MEQTIGGRILRIIQEQGLKKVEFARRIKVDQAYVTQLTTDKRNPSDRLIDAICREFGIREAWLRTGEGEMYNPPDSFSLDDLVQECGVDEAERETVKNLVRAYFSLREDTRQEILARFYETFSSMPPRAAYLGPSINHKDETMETEEERHERHKREARAEADEYYEELLREKIAADESEAFGQSGGGGMLA